jgi:uncharacterized phiE125 gp8 family phage protein
VFALSIPPISETDALELVPLAEVKSHLRIDGAEYDDDVKRILRAAIDTAGVESGRVFGLRQGCVYSSPRFPDGHGSIFVGVPVTTFSSIEYIGIDGTNKTFAIAKTVASVRTGELFALGEWPTDAREPGAVRVTFTAGETEIGNIAQRAILLIAAEWFEHRGDDERKQDIPVGAKRLLFQIHSGGIVS